MNFLDKGMFRKPVKASLVKLVIVVLVLNIIDAYTTIYLVGRGMTELNQLHVLFMNFGTEFFLAGKILTATFLVIALAVFHRTDLIAVTIAFGVYLLNAIYQIGIVGYLAWFGY